MVVVGIGNSGGDIAVEISRSAEKVKCKRLVCHGGMGLREMIKCRLYRFCIDRPFSVHVKGPGCWAGCPPMAFLSTLQ